MRYILRKAVLDFCPEVEISEQEFKELKIARQILIDAFEIEQKYEIVITNFIDLEKELLNISVKNALRNKRSYLDFFDDRSILNTRVINLMTATRLYIDQLPKHLNRCDIHSQNFLEAFRTKCSEEYDGKFEYRFMEAMRNHVQHHDLPIDGISSRLERSRDENNLIEYSTQLFIKADALAKNEKFKKSILDEIQDKINLVSSSRIYIQSISDIHQHIRNLIEPVTISSRAKIESAHEKYASIYSGTLIGLSAIEKKDEKQISSLPLLLDWDDVRIQLKERNPRFNDLAGKLIVNKTS